MTNWEELLGREELTATANSRGMVTIQEKVNANQIDERQKNGWSIIKSYKNGQALMERPKKTGDSFEDEVWTIFYKMGFKILNRSNKFKLAYSSENPNLTKQIDVVAIDDEVCLLIECKETTIVGNQYQWKKDIESIKGIKEGLFSEIRTHYPNRKVKYIFATKNYAIGQQDVDRMKEANIANFDTDTIRYYSDLVNHLGTAARYQLLGRLFARQKISEMEQKIPAIQGKMGGLTYYSFSIEPERLLKIAYVLHRTNANRDSMPTYQRIIKKDRLNGIRQFINNGGFFPNSLIISIDTNGRGLKFDYANNNIKDSISKIGILYLPPIYQSAYVIDGQHRLYGYSDSNFSETNSIPVVAFVDLDKNVQVKMFMDINENQKAVSKSLRNTLNIDLLWDSKNNNERRLSLMLYIAQKLGEDSNSPLYGRVITGENTQTTDRCISIEYIKEALTKSCFFNTYKKNNSVEKTGVFEKYGEISNNKTADLVYPFIIKCLKLVKDFCTDEWNKGSNGFLTINNFMYALLRVINDIVEIVVEKEKIDVIDDYNFLYEKCEPLLFNLIDVIMNLDPDTVVKIKIAKGEGAKKDSWRLLQKAFNNKYPDFINEDLKHYIEETESNNNPEAEEKLTIIENKIVELVKTRFKENKNWLMEFVPEATRFKLISDAANENAKYKYNQIDKRVSEIDFINFVSASEIVAYSNNWSAYYQNVFVKDDFIKTKTEFLTMLKNLNQLKNRISRKEMITKSQLEEITKIYNVFNEEQ